MSKVESLRLQAYGKVMASVVKAVEKAAEVYSTDDNLVALAKALPGEVKELEDKAKAKKKKKETFFRAYLQETLLFLAQTLASKYSADEGLKELAEKLPQALQVISQATEEELLVAL